MKYDEKVHHTLWALSFFFFLIVLPWFGHVFSNKGRFGHKRKLPGFFYFLSWYGESTTIYTGFLYIRGGFLARFLVAINSTRTLNRTEAESKFLFVSSPAGVSSSERRVRCQFVRKLTGNASENRLFYSKEKPDQACSCGGCNLIFQIRDFFYPPWNLHGPWKSMVGRWISFWEGLCHWWTY